MTLPTFLIIGEQKCGTGWIRDRLVEHPAVFMAQKELNFFNRKEEFRRGLAFYSRHFKKAKEEIVGEKSPNYFWENSGLPDYNQEIFPLIADALPNARIMLVLRSPIERAISALLHHTLHRGRRIHPRLVRQHTISELLLKGKGSFSHLGILERGFYSHRLQRAREIFGDRLSVLIFETDIVANPSRGLAKICEHIGAEQYDGFRYRENPKAQKPSYPAAYLSYAIEPARPIIRFFDKGEPFRPNVTDACRRELWQHYENDVEEVERLLETELSVWRPQCLR